MTTQNKTETRVECLSHLEWHFHWNPTPPTTHHINAHTREREKNLLSQVINYLYYHSYHYFCYYSSFVLHFASDERPHCVTRSTCAKKPTHSLQLGFQWTAPSIQWLSATDRAQVWHFPDHSKSSTSSVVMMMSLPLVANPSLQCFLTLWVYCKASALSQHVCGWRLLAEQVIQLGEQSRAVWHFSSTLVSKWPNFSLYL